MIIVTHSEMILNALATRLIVFDGGKVTLFEGTYQDFLDRVGWESENEAPQAGADENISEKQPVNRKHLRRIKAELINERSRTLRLLQDKIDGIEKEIIKLEEKTGQDNSDLLDASVAGSGEDIKRLSKAIHASRLRIDKLFSELEVLHDELDSRSKEFEDKLSAMEA
jgi:ATP-binding cassette subfamily F protein 3